MAKLLKLPTTFSQSVYVWMPCETTISEIETQCRVQPEAPVLVHYKLWQEITQLKSLEIGGAKILPWLDGDDSLHDLTNTVALNSIDLIALHFPKFTDGRPYTLASRLRRTCDYKGHLLATGDIGIDQLQYMERCGFDMFILQKDYEETEVLKALSCFQEHYQSLVTNPVPLFRRQQFA
jgi:uncharacterized protein (DUF934 family)